MKGRSALYKGDTGLYAVLLKRKDSQGRKLLDSVFSGIEKSREKEAAQDLLDGLAAYSNAA